MCMCDACINEFLALAREWATEERTISIIQSGANDAN